MGDVLISPQDADHSYVQYLFDKEIRVSFMSPPSERCLPLTVLHTIASNGPWFKLVPAEQHVHGLDQLYTTCLEEAKVLSNFYTHQQIDVLFNEPIYMSSHQRESR